MTTAYTPEQLEAADRLVAAVLQLTTTDVNGVPTTGEIAAHLGWSISATTAAANVEWANGRRLARTHAYREVDRVKGYGNFCGTTSRERVAWQPSYSWLLKLAKQTKEN